MKSSIIKVFAPATVANVAVGFDILGFAIHGPGDEIWVRAGSRPGLQITQITGTGDKQLPLEAKKNTAGFAALGLLDELGKSDISIEMEIHKQMPFGSGLGSSAASAAAGVMAVNEFLDRPLAKKDLLPFAVAGEQVADGAYHADNVGPSLLGGVTFIRDNRTLDTHQLPVPQDLYACVVYPYVEILTKDSRNILSESNLLSQTIQQTGNLGALIIGLYESDYALIGRALTDAIIEPQRAKLIPNFSAVKKAALNSGALGASISGAGPSCFALCQGKEKANKVAFAMQQAFASVEINSEVFVSAINTQGCIRIQ